MSNSHPLLLSIALGFFLCANVGYSEQYVIVDSEKGDRLTGIWGGASETHFEIDYDGQRLRLPLSGYTLRFTSRREHAPGRTADKYFQNGRDLLDLGFPELAKRRFEFALEEFPKYADAHYQLGLLHKAGGNTDEALKHFRSVALIDAANFELVPLLQEIGDLALADEAYAAAVNTYQLILTHYPEHESVQKLSYRTGFLCLEKLQDTVAALPVLESAIKRFPDAPAHEKALFLIGKLQAEIATDTTQLENARYTLGGFVQRYPESEWVDDALLARAIVNLKLDSKADAAEDAELLLSYSKDDALKERASEIRAESAWTVYTESDGLPDNAIQALTAVGSWLWIGTPNGVMPIETADRKWTPMEAVAQPINAQFETAPDVRAIAANAHELWLGTRHQGVLYYNMETSTMRLYQYPDALPSNWIRDIKFDEDEVWFATDAGVVRLIAESGNFLIYNTQNSFIPTDDIHTLALTPTTVWVASLDGDVATFNRDVQGWRDYHSVEMEQGSAIVRFEVAAEKLLFTWFNAEAKINGYFEADIDGNNGQSTTLLTGIEERAVLDDIYIAGVTDNSPQSPEVNEISPVESTTSDSEVPDDDDGGEFGETYDEGIEAPEGTEDGAYEAPGEVEEPEFGELDDGEFDVPDDNEFGEPEVQREKIGAAPAPESGTPLVLWIVTNDDVSTYYTRSNTWEAIRTPQTVMGKSIVHSIALMKDRAWIGTSNGLAVIQTHVLRKP